RGRGRQAAGVAAGVRHVAIAGARQVRRDVSRSAARRSRGRDAGIVAGDPLRDRVHRSARALALQHVPRPLDRRVAPAVTRHLRNRTLRAGRGARADERALPAPIAGPCDLSHTDAAAKLTAATRIFVKKPESRDLFLAWLAPAIYDTPLGDNPDGRARNAGPCCP